MNVLMWAALAFGLVVVPLVRILGWFAMWLEKRDA